MKKPPPKREFMEGGIATSYYVVKALTEFQREATATWDQTAIEDIANFFRVRIRHDGIGVCAMDSKGFSRVLAHLRHTCFGFLILSQLAEACVDSEELNSLARKSAALLVRSLSRDELLQELIIEQWPVGGIASYIAARDRVYGSAFGDVWPSHEMRYWPGVRETMLDALAQLTSTQLNSNRGKTESCPNQLEEHFPYWHPIEDAVILRLHSTLGCLSLVGEELAKREIGRRRICEIVDDMREQVLQDAGHAPRFCRDSEPSLAAACAMLKMVLGPWYELEAQDRRFLFHVLDFISREWRNPDAYRDYWTEFTAPILQIKELRRHLDLGSLVQRAAPFIKDTDLGGVCASRDTGNDSDGEFSEVLNQITPMALGVAPT